MSIKNMNSHRVIFQKAYKKTFSMSFQIGLDVNKYHDLWGPPAPETWSVEAWILLLQTLPIGKGLRRPVVWLPQSAPLQALLDAIAQYPSDLLRDLSILVKRGTVTMDALETAVTGCQQRGLDIVFCLAVVVVVVDKDGQEGAGSVGGRREVLCGSRTRTGQRMVQEPRWRTG